MFSDRLRQKGAAGSAGLQEKADGGAGSEGINTRGVICLLLGALMRRGLSTAGRM